MPFLQTSAVVLKKTLLNENDLLLHLFTPESGLIKAVLKGVRKPQAKLISFGEPFVLAEVMLARQQVYGFHKITQVRLLQGFPGLRSDLARIGYASYMAELILETQGGEEKSHALFQAVLKGLGGLESAPDPEAVALLWSLWYLAELGYRPHLSDCVVCHSKLEFGPESARPGAFFSNRQGGALCRKCSIQHEGVEVRDRRTFGLVEEAGSGGFLKAAMTGPQKGEVRQIARSAVSYHCGRELKSLSFLKKVGVGLALLLACLFSSQLVQGQSTTGPDSLKAEMSPRAVAMGSAYSAVGDDVTVAYWNPASLVRVSYLQAAFVHQLPFLDSTCDWGGIAVPMGENYILGGSFLYMATAPFQQYDDSAQPIATLENYDWVATLSLAQKYEALGIGVSLKYFVSKLYVYTASGLAADMGLIYKVPNTQKLFFSVSLTNLGAGIRYLDESDPLPTKIRLGCSYGFWSDFFNRHLISAELEAPLDPGEQKLLDTGYEWWITRTVSLRGGYRWGMSEGALTFGMGFAVEGWNMDYSFVPIGQVGSAHKLSILRNWF